VYIGLLLLHTVQFIKRFASLYFIRNRQLLKAPVDTRIFTAQTALHIGIRKKVTIWLSENVEVPSVIGFFKPIILLPVAALIHLTADQAESIILHELAHIKRNDYLVNLLQSFIELVLFFNPFAKLLGHAARKERENCCDDWVLNYQYNKHDYAAALLMLEQQRTQRVTLALAATNGKKNLLGRIKRLFVAKPQTSINFSQQIKLVFVSMLLLAGMFFLLPTVKRQAAIKQATAKKHTVLPTLVAAKTNTDNFTELIPDKIINNQPVQTASVTEKEEAQKKQVNKVEKVEYSTALINEELLNGDKEPQNIPVQVAEKESASYPQLLVRVEEEQSGVKEKNTYVLQLKNNNGRPEIKPLLILNRKMKALSGKLKAINKAALADSVKLSLKKRITS
jgi:BlaR1 peptidase M56